MRRLQYIPLTAPKNLLTDVENRRIYTLDRCELNVFETYRPAELVELTFHDLVITSMVRGKKVMHLPGSNAFEYLPGETVLAPADTKMFIDFPDAQKNDPTQCIALTLDGDSVKQTINYLNDRFPRHEQHASWDLDFRFTHLRNSNVLAGVINKMVSVCSEKSIAKDILADLTLKELIVRLVQLQHLAEVTEYVPSANNPFGHLTEYIRANLSSKIDVETLCRKAYMSRANFFRAFKREYGISPVQYIIRERLKRAKVLLTGTNQSVAQICMETGFEDVNNFIKTFKRAEGTTPGYYRSKLL